MWLLQKFNFKFCLIRVQKWSSEFCLLLVLLYSHLEPVRMTDKNKLSIEWFLEKVCFVSTKWKLNRCSFVGCFFFFLTVLCFLHRKTRFPVVFLCSLIWWHLFHEVFIIPTHSARLGSTYTVMPSHRWSYYVVTWKDSTIRSTDKMCFS